ncbi:MAG: alpha-hydroxy-acid oxidizing protein, partial [Acidaminococcaceae bacterium]|nr:alpha-hydroxy-acid oxidizing protein [Acidaminococcaceae bacterium]
QYGTVTRKEGIKSFEVVRKYNPNGIIFANLSADAKPDVVENAIEMIAADGLQLHLNVAQELVMPEGDRDFSGYLHNIELICAKTQVPVIVKETGCGMTKEQVRQLLNCGVAAVDVGGAGGTNFLAIEAARRQDSGYNELLSWGIPTALSILEARIIVAGNNCGLIASGGIRNALDMAKALALGADAVGMAGNILLKIKLEGVSSAVQEITKMFELLRNIMLLTGCNNVAGLRKIPLLFSGTLFQHIACRGYDLPTISNQR